MSTSDQAHDFDALFAPEPPARESIGFALPAWKVLLVDDETDIHAALHLALSDMIVEGRPLQLLDAKSAEAAKSMLAEHPDTALILLDVVMESHHAGLDLVRFIRHELQNRTAQIVLITGQPGYAPARSVVIECEIDGYQLKSELTADKIFVSVYAAIRAYQALHGLEAQRHHLEAQSLALRENEARLRAVVETAPDAIILVDTSVRVLGWNEGARRIFGHTAEEITGQPITCILPQQTDALHEAVMANIRAGRMDRYLGKITELEALHRDGKTFPVELVLGAWNATGGRKYSAVVRDISERQASIKAMAKAKEMAEQANRSKSLFLANMSHEIRTPLNAILGMVELCLTTEPTARQAAYLKKILMASEFLLRVIDDILDFSKVEAGRLDLFEQPFALHGVFESVSSMLRHKAEAKGLALDIDLADVPPLTLLGDAGRLSQILVNLVGNAIKFSQQGHIGIKIVKLERTQSKAVLHFAVSDEGIGIGEEQQPRLFQAFSQADASTTRTHGGTGLGLALCKRLVELMGGRIWCESTQGSGSTFHFTACFAVTAPMPAAEGTTTGGAIDIDALRRLRGADILVVEDSEMNQELMRDLLERAGCRVRIAASGAEALRAVGERRPDCILMDCQMPVMDGYEATRRLRSEPALRELPVIALTANVTIDDRDACRDAGMIDFLAKPLRSRELFATLLRWLPAPQAYFTSVAFNQHQIPSSNFSGCASLPADLPGIDQAQGLDHFDGSLALYTSMLRKFRDQRARQVADDLQRAIKGDDWRRACRIAHSLKGVARTLGAMQLGERAYRFEQAARAEDAEGVRQSLPLVEAELRKVVEGLATLGEHEPLATTERSRSACGLSELIRLIDEQDTAAVESIGWLHKELADRGWHREADRICAAIARYAFDEAAAELRQLNFDAGENR